MEVIPGERVVERVVVMVVSLFWTSVGFLWKCLGE